MRSLPERLKIHSFKLSRADQRRYFLARMAPTFNRGYDVEGHVLDAMQRAPFAATDPRQGLSLVHFSAQPEPFLTQNTSSPSPNTPQTPPKHPLYFPYMHPLSHSKRLR